MGIPDRFGTLLADSLLHEADLILVVGSSLAQATTSDWRLIRAQQQMIQIDSDRGCIGRLAGRAGDSGGL